MPAHDPVERLLIAVKGGSTSAAGKTQAEHDAAMAKVRDAGDEALRKQFVAQIDPDGSLAAADPDDLERRLRLMRRAHYAEMARRSHVARRAQREAAEVGAA